MLTFPPLAITVMNLPITTQRLILDEVALSDADFILELLNSPGWLRYIGDRGVHNREDAIHYIQSRFIQSYQDNGFGLYKAALKDTGEPIGLCGFLRRDYLPSVDIGFALLPAFEGKGFAFEAAQALMETGFGELGFDTVMAIVLPDNLRSQVLLEKLGLRKTGSHLREGEALWVYSTSA